MKFVIRFFLFALVCLSANSDDSLDVRKLMTEEEFRAAGLSTLSSSQIEVINHWLMRYTVQDAALVLKNNKNVKQLANDEMLSRVDGDFKGWNGTTRFNLKNGQVWETRHKQRYIYSAIDPEIKIEKNMLGFYVFTVIETGQSIGVKRVK